LIIFADSLFAAIGLSHLVRPPFYGRLFVRALLEIGYFSLPVVALFFSLQKYLVSGLTAGGVKG
jgi:ABC-type maltose transport system permease subunit